MTRHPLTVFFGFIVLILVIGLACSFPSVPDVSIEIPEEVGEVMDQASDLLDQAGDIVDSIDIVVVEDPSTNTGNTGNQSGNTDDPQGSTEIGPAPTGMVAIPAGNFQMGCANSEHFDCSTPGYERETPLHTVYLDGYFIDPTMARTFTQTTITVTHSMRTTL